LALLRDLEIGRGKASQRDWHFNGHELKSSEFKGSGARFSQEVEPLPYRIRLAPELQSGVVGEGGIWRQLRGHEVGIDWRRNGVRAAWHDRVHSAPNPHQASVSDVPAQKTIGCPWAPRLPAVFPEAVCVCEMLEVVGIPAADIAEERARMSVIAFGRTRSRSLLGTR